MEGVGLRAFPHGAYTSRVAPIRITTQRTAGSGKLNSSQGHAEPAPQRLVALLLEGFGLRALPRLGAARFDARGLREGAFAGHFHPALMTAGAFT